MEGARRRSCLDNQDGIDSTVCPFLSSCQIAGGSHSGLEETASLGPQAQLKALDFYSKMDFSIFVQIPF